MPKIPHYSEFGPGLHILVLRTHSLNACLNILLRNQLGQMRRNSALMQMRRLQQGKAAARRAWSPTHDALGTKRDCAWCALLLSACKQSASGGLSLVPAFSSLGPGGAGVALHSFGYQDGLTRPCPLVRQTMNFEETPRMVTSCQISWIRLLQGLPSLASGTNAPFHGRLQS